MKEEKLCGGLVTIINVAIEFSKKKVLKTFTKSCKLSRIHFKRDLTKAFRRCLVKIYSARPITTSIDNPRKPKRVFRLPTSNFQLPTSDFRPPTSDFQLPTSDFRLPTSVAMKDGDRPPFTLC